MKTEENDSDDQNGGKKEIKKENPAPEVKAYKQSITQQDLDNVVATFEAKMQMLHRELEQERAKNNSRNSDSSIERLADVIVDKKKGDVSTHEGIDESQIPLDDILVDKADWVTFFVPSAGYVIVDDVRNGFTVLPPYKKKSIFFTHINTGRAQIGKNVVLTPIAQYTSKSKKEIEWLKGHSFYGTFIFTSTARAADANAVKALRLGTVLNIIRVKDFPSIVHDANSLGVPFIENKDELAIRVAQAIVEREIVAQGAAVEARAKENFEDAAMVGKLLSS